MSGPGWSPDFKRLWAALGTSNIADGITFSAGPLLVTSLTTDPFLVGLAVAVQFAPTLLFALLAGAVVDRVDRRRLQTVTHTFRALVLVGLVASIATGSVTLPIVYGVVFAANSSLHSYLILAYADGDDVSTDVGFYYSANAAGRLVGTLLSGLLYLQGGIDAALWGSALFVAATWLLTLRLPTLD